MEFNLIQQIDREIKVFRPNNAFSLASLLILEVCYFLQDNFCLWSYFLGSVGIHKD